MGSTTLTKLGFTTWEMFTWASQKNVLSGLPENPGIYIVLLSEPEPRRSGCSDIAYVGKATNQKGLRHRVSRYFHPGPTQTTNLAMKLRICSEDCALRLGFVALESIAAARRLESDLLLGFEREHGELPPYNRQRSLDLMARFGEP
jgi:hypothetical protein